MICKGIWNDICVSCRVSDLADKSSIISSGVRKGKSAQRKASGLVLSTDGERARKYVLFVIFSTLFFGDGLVPAPE